VNIVYPNDFSSASIEALLDAADSEVLFLGDPRVSIEPGPHMFERMTRVVRETGAAWFIATPSAMHESNIRLAASATASTSAVWLEFRFKLPVRRDSMAD
jgi:hypothetical protein